jgi:DNA polymerase-3 subunit gamma/tau
MTYIVLARRWRPQQFNELIGQEHVSKTLANAIETGRIAHSYIFAGPRGIGKTTTARILAKALNCEKGPTSTPCDACSPCQSIIKGNSLDVLEIDGASNRGIDEIRNLRENIRFTPSQGKYRIYIIDEVHMLTKEAFNALLKTLEEPPKHAIFIFATTEIFRVPATILSRCQRFDFKRIAINTIIDQLQRICAAENIQVEVDALLQIAKKADGSMRDAQSILDQIISYSGEKISAAQVGTALGIIDQELYFKFTDKIRQRDINALLLLCQQVNSEGYDLGEFLTGFEEHFRNLLVAKSLRSMELIHVAEHFHQQYLQESQNFDISDLLMYLQIIADIQKEFKWTLQPYLKFELAMLKMAQSPSALDIEKLLDKLNLLKKKADQPKSIAHSVSSTPAPAPPPTVDAKAGEAVSFNFSLAGIQQVWPQLVDKFRQTKVNLGNAMEFGTPDKLEDSILTVRYESIDSFHNTWLNKNKKHVEDALGNIFKQAVHIETQLQNNPDAQPRKSATATVAEDKRDLHKLMKEDELLNKLINDLGLELTRGGNNS